MSSSAAAPRSPRVRAMADEEKTARDEKRAAWERAQEADRAARAIVDARDSRDATASPYDLLSEALMNCITDQVFAVIHGPDFAAALRERGYVVVPALPAGQVPDAPAEWMHAGIDLLGAAGERAYPVDDLYDLWFKAYTAGAEGRGAATDLPDATETPGTGEA